MKDANKQEEEKRLMRWVSNLIEQSKESKFWGKMTITWENGVPKHVVYQQSIKPPEKS